MKKLFLLIALCFYFFTLNSGAVLAAAEATESSENQKTKQIEDLKERLATKVAQLRQVERKAVSGTVKTISIASLTIETPTKDVKIELTDNIKIYQMIKGKRTKLSTDDLDRGDYIIVFGNYDITLDVQEAQVIIIQNQIPLRVSGIVQSTDTKAFTVNLVTANNQEYTIDYETTTKTFEWSKDDGTVKAGFSKITDGTFVSVLGYPVPRKENRISAERILAINLNPPQIASPSTTAKSAKITPSPRATIRVTSKPTIKPTLTPAQ